ncbi:hypothetical protein [Micromonospora sp. NPDC005367]|uniref:hypothetical protein n=1 Tax=Micromonospora sp. NPDC005367 TaxID=3155590 RepID=UPI0033B70F17
MSIIASVPVPAGSRLIDAATVDMQAIRRPRPADERFPVLNSTRTADKARQAWDAVNRPGATMADVQATAERLGVNVAELLELSLDHIAHTTGWDRGVGLRPGDPYAGVSGNPALCPTWCPGTCGNHAERSHVRPIVDMSVRHGDLVDEQVEIRARMQAYESPDLPGGIEPTEVFVEVAGLGDTVCSASLTLEQAEQLGQALLDAARQGRR